jgi:AcrR family transcriptional regulator
MSNTKKKLPGRPRSAQSHQAMLQAALELLAEVGFGGISMDAIASRAGIGKTTIYRRYNSKEELIADAIESIREEIIIPDTGNLQSDIDMLLENAARITLAPQGTKAVAMIISSASSHPQFASIYWKKYLQPRRKAFAVVIDRAKQRKEIPADLDSGLIFDTMSGIMLYAQIFPPDSESWIDYVRRSLNLLLRNV